MFFIGVDYSNTSPVYLMRQLIYAIGIGAQVFKKKTQSSVAVVGLLGRQLSIRNKNHLETCYI
jgi:hypothetical protein